VNRILSVAMFRCLWAFLALFCLSARAEMSEVTHGWDLGFNTGLSVGSITQNNLVTPRTYDLGGFPLGVLFTQNVNPTWTLQFGADMLLDGGSFSITRNGFSAAGLYHLYGGARSVVREYGGDRVVSGDPMNLSLLTRLELHTYHASAKGTDITLTGSLLELSFGAEYRFDVSENAALAFQLTTTLLSLASSLERLSQHMILFSAMYRFYL
jgi:hypothetical protein